jgi:transcriptional regulator with XRE-family HTH domain
MNIGEKIKEARLAKGMTQQELGELLGVQKSAIAKYESGRVVNIKRSTLKKISDILGIRPAELIFDANTPPEKVIDIAEIHTEILTDLDFAELYEDFKKLDKKKRTIVKDLVRNLADSEI